MKKYSLKLTAILFYGLFLIGTLFLSIRSTQAQHLDSDKPAVHGMLIFGKHTIYASHLPMFHKPHQYQVILEIEISKKDKAIFIQDQQKNPDNNTYTIAPGRFILPEMMKNPKAFNAMLYRGHFERGGKAISDSIRVSVKKIILFSLLPQDNPSKQNHYILIGNANEQFAIHRITHAPDFDHIVQIRCSEKNYPLTVTTMRPEEQLPNVSGNWETLQDTVENKPIALQWLRQLYLEFDDLKETPDEY